MAKIELNPLDSAYNLTTAVNQRLQDIEDTFNDNVLWRDGFASEPNAMHVDLNMGGNNILNAVLVDSTLVSGDSDKLDGQDGSYYLDRANHSGSVDVGDISGTIVADEVAVTTENSSASAHYPVFVDAITGDQVIKADNGISYTPSANLLTLSSVYLSSAPTVGNHATTKAYVDAEVAGASGAVAISGTPANNQLAIWTAADTIEGDADVTWNGAELNINGNINIQQSVDDYTIDAEYTGSGVGAGVYGYAGTNGYGLYGRAGGDQRAGVYGESNRTSGGTAYGVYGHVNNTSGVGIGGFFGNSKNGTQVRLAEDTNLVQGLVFGSERFTITSAGDASFDGGVDATDFNSVALTTGGASTSYLNAQGNYTAPSGTTPPVFFSDPQLIYSSSSPPTSWTLIDMSALGGDAAAAVTAGATAYIFRVATWAEDTFAGLRIIETHLRATGSGLAAGNKCRVSYDRFGGPTSGAYASRQATEHTIPAGTNGDIDIETGWSSLPNYSVEIYFVGYYV